MLYNLVKKGDKMKIVIEGKNIELTDALKGHINDKLKKLDKHFENIIKGHDVKVKLSVAKNPRISKSNTVEITVFLDGRIVRSEHSSEDMYVSIDSVISKLNRQIDKYKTQVYRSYKNTERPMPNPGLKDKLIPEEGLTNGKIIKKKRFKLHPMSPEEAITHLDLIGHDFYLFINTDTKQINTIYLRKDGDYGLIEPVE